MQDFWGGWSDEVLFGVFSERTVPTDWGFIRQRAGGWLIAFWLVGNGLQTDSLRAQDRAPNGLPGEKTEGQARIPSRPPLAPHRFSDSTNVLLFAGVGGARTLDYTSTRHFRNKGVNEKLLTNAIVDNKPLFAAIEVAGVGASIGFSYLFHRTGHHKLER